MYWSVSQNVISELFVRGENIIYPWGIETADSSAFFSLQEGCGYRYRVLSEEYHYSETHYEAQLDIEMQEGKWNLILKDEILSPTKIVRTALLTCLEDSYFMDFVMRFRFKKEFFPYARIAEEKISHHCTNIYYQHPVREAYLKGKYGVAISIQECKVFEKMAPYMYVRDAEKEWVVHARMLPQVSDKEVIKLCNWWAKTRPLPQWISQPLLACSPIRKALWYRGERKPFHDPIMRRLNPLACPLVTATKGESLMWKVEVTIGDGL